jgi:hypothetical protein
MGLCICAYFLALIILNSIYTTDRFPQASQRNKANTFQHTSYLDSLVRKQASLYNKFITVLYYLTREGHSFTVTRSFEEIKRFYDYVMSDEQLGPNRKLLKVTISYILDNIQILNLNNAILAILVNSVHFHLVRRGKTM